MKKDLSEEIVNIQSGSMAWTSFYIKLSQLHQPIIGKEGGGEEGISHVKW